jgi:hypothetical protein
MRVGSTYYVIGSDTHVRMPVTRVTDLSATYTESSWVAATVEGMPTRPAWAVDDVLWAPTVAHFPGRYVLWFAANRKDPPDPANRQCLGRAFAFSPEGPYIAEREPFSCGIDGVYGALDPEIFIEPTGGVWLYAAFGNTASPIHVFAMDHNGDPTSRRADGQAEYWGIPIVGRTHGWEGRFIENPSMVYDPATDTFLMSYSAGDWWTPEYSTGLARCASPVGNCVTNEDGPWLAAGPGRTGSGGFSFFTATDGSTKGAYASFAAGQEGPGGARFFTTVNVQLGTAPTITPISPGR